MRSIVTTYDRLADDPQARETFLGLVDIDHDMVTSYRHTLRAAATPRRPRRSPGHCRRITGYTVTFTVRPTR